MKIENTTKVVEKFLNRESQANLAREYGCSREAIRLVLNKYLGKQGVQNLYNNWEIDDVNLIYYLLKENSLLTLEDLAQETGLGVGRIRLLLDKYGIKRDIPQILSDRITKAKAQGRIELTKEYLQELYLDKDMTAKEISQRTGYDTVTINKYIQKYRLLKRPYAANVVENKS